MSTKIYLKFFVMVIALLLLASCGNGTSAEDAGDGDEDVLDALEAVDTDADGELQEILDIADTEGDEEIPACGSGVEDGVVCGEDPRSICIDGACTPSECGDGFVDVGADESCEPPGAGACSSECRWLCETNENCPDDGEICNGEEYCDTGAHECSRRNPLEDGTVCGADPRRLCIARTCQASTCGDRFTDEVLGEECDDGMNGDPDDGCTDACEYSCHVNTDCEEDANPCAIGICDTTSSHACLYLANPFEALCRRSAGECDVAEFCDGVNRECPVDVFMPPTTECRASAAACDPAELCTGMSADCPEDVLTPSGTTCDDGIFCTYPDTCDETGTCIGEPMPWLYGVSVIGAGDTHTCAAMNTGAAKCWGYNFYGQLGDGTTTARYAPVDVLGLSSGVSSIAGGRYHTCALMGSGGVKCWGQNDYAQLGDGTTMQRLTPVDVSGLSSGVSGIAAAGFHSCALISTGGVKCWGNNGEGQLGDGTTTNRLTPVDVSGLTAGVSAITTADFHTCALMSTGGVKCWGNNGHGQLGDGTTTTRLIPVDVSGLSAGVSAIVAAGFGHTCALMSTGGVKCWGYNSNGQLGDGTAMDRLTPVDVSGMSSGVVALTGGRYHTCAVLGTGGVKCWGNNNAGQLGDGTTTQKLTPVDVSGLSSSASVIAAGRYHTCASMSSGGVKCWGSNLFGELGDGTTTERHTPVDVLCE